MADQNKKTKGIFNKLFHQKLRRSEPSNSDRVDAVSNHSRRDLFKHAGLVGAAVIGSSAVTTSITAESAVQEASTAPPKIPLREALETLTAAESLTLDAMVSRIIPADALGPGAREARATHYIDKALMGPRSGSREAYAIGLLALNEYSEANRGKAFHLLGEAEQDALLMELQDNNIEDFGIDASSFFNMVRSHTIEGTFSDPYYGGNRDFIGWDMLGYPGIRLGASENDVSQGSDLSPSHRSAYDNQAFVKSRSKGDH
jgi:gluconate 2-dehydrogenase gamma chain